MVNTPAGTEVWKTAGMLPFEIGNSLRWLEKHMWDIVKHLCVPEDWVSPAENAGLKQEGLVFAPQKADWTNKYDASCAKHMAIEPMRRYSICQ